MPGAKFRALVERFVNALELASARVWLAAPGRSRPQRCTVVAQHLVYQLDLNLWAVTPGGKGRNRPRERRVQATGVDRFVLRPGVRAIVGGWSDETHTFVFWDARRHQHFTAGSPSLQISLDTLERAERDGLAAETRHVREGDEIAIAVHPDYLLWYLEESERLYECTDQIDHANDLIEADPEREMAFIDEGANDLMRARRHKVVSIVQRFREAQFRPQVLRAYNYRCAISAVALRLVDAAHIIPVTDPRSTDKPHNGIALNPLYHRAYDSGLLGILPGGRLRLNERIVQELTRAGLASGLDHLRQELPARMSYPPLSEFHPRDQDLARGVLLRGWTTEEIDAA